MTETATRPDELVRTIYRSFNERRFGEAKRLVAEDARTTSFALGRTLHGPEGFVQSMEHWVQAFPDAQMEIRNVIAAEAYVVVEFVVRGTHRGPLDLPGGPIPATGGSVEVEYCDLWQIEDGTVLDHRSYFDAATMMRELGLLPVIPHDEIEEIGTPAERPLLEPPPAAP